MISQHTLPAGKSFVLLLLLSFFAASESAFAESSDSLFDFSEDIRIFTAYAMMNAAGNVGEWNRAGMDPIRSELRADLAGRIDSSFQAKIRAFNQSHGRVLETYEAALLTSGPPDFHWSYNPKNTGDLEETVFADSTFPDLLAEFYRKVNVAQLWDEYRPIIQAENDKYKPFADQAMEDVDKYCRLDTDYFYSNGKRIHFEFMPLIPYFTSMTARVNGEIYIIVGPQEEKPDRSMFYYHLLNRVTIPLVRNDSEDVSRLAGLFDAVKSKVDIRRGNWKILVAEWFAEAADMSLEQKLYDRDTTTSQASLMNEYKYGFILTPTIYRDLQKYEESGMKFGEYFPRILESIDYRHEVEKWNEFWAKR